MTNKENRFSPMCLFCVWCVYVSPVQVVWIHDNLAVSSEPQFH